MLEIFGRQKGKLKYSGLVDCKTGEEFNETLAVLKSKWDKCEEGLKVGKLSFYDWFARYKVRCHMLFITQLLRKLLVGGCNLNFYNIQFLMNF